jgi:hypothetical protein
MHHHVSVSVSISTGCSEHDRLLEELSQAIDFLVKSQASHATVLRITGCGTTGYEEDLSVATSAWTVARRAFVQHVMEHGC